MKLTVDIIDDFIQSLDLSGDVLSFSDDGTDTTLIVENTFHARTGMVLDVDGLPFTILSVVFATSITVSGLPAVPFNYTVPLPFYFHGTPIATNNQISGANHVDKVPMIYLHEILKEKDKDIFSAVKRDSDVRLFFLDSANFTDWSTDDHYSKLLLGLNALVDAFESQAKKSNLFFLDETEFSRVNHVKWGTFQDSKGHIKNIFNEKLTGVELSLTLPLTDCEDKVITPRLPCPTLQERWDESTDPKKNDFVDNNEAEIVSFLDDIIQLSAEAGSAINNIESNGGTLTDEEKFFVAIWVDRMQANGDLTTRDILVYPGFEDNLCNVVDWINGKIATNSGTTLDGQHWDLDGINNFLNLNWNATDDGSNYTQNDSTIGVYIYSQEDNLGTDSFFGSREVAGADVIYRNDGSGSFARMNDDEAGTISHKPLNRTLVTLQRISSAAYDLFINGIDTDGANEASTGLPSIDCYLGANNFDGIDNGHIKAKIDLFHAGGATGLDHLDFYIGFEDFRTSLHPEILYNMSQKTGQVTSYRDGDDAWIEDNYLDHFRQGQTFWNGVRPELVNFTTLKQNNAFGNTNRFTDDLGTQIYTADLIIDHYTGDMWYRITSSAIWNTTIADGLGTLFGGSQSQGGFNNWKVKNLSEFMSVVDMDESTNALGYSPFNSPSSTMWTSSTDPQTTVNAMFPRLTNYTGGLIDSAGKTANVNYLIVRKHY